jgi:uncharacterized protein
VTSILVPPPNQKTRTCVLVYARRSPSLWAATQQWKREQAMATPEAPKKTSGMSVREAGQKGGQTVKKKYGPEFYEQIGRKGGLATKQAHGHEFYEQIGKKGGKKGGEATRDRYGPDFYERIGQKGGQKVKQLIEEGKRAAASHESTREERAS